MKPDRWKEIEKLYEVCISLPQHARAFLREPAPTRKYAAK